MGAENSNRQPEEPSVLKLDRLVYILAMVAIIIMLFACVADYYVATNIQRPPGPTATVTRTRMPTYTPTITHTPVFAQRRLIPPIPNLQAASLLTPLMERGFTCSGYDASDDRVYSAECFYDFEGLSLNAELTGFNARQVDTVLLTVRNEQALDEDLVVDFFSFISALPLIEQLQITVTPTMQMPRTSTPAGPDPQATPLPTLVIPTPVRLNNADSQDTLISALKDWLDALRGVTDLDDSLQINGLRLTLQRRGSTATLRLGMPIDLP